MKQWNFEPEDDYAGPATGAWWWISTGIAFWVVVIWWAFEF
jgi:hypothetical protein